MQLLKYVLVENWRVVDPNSFDGLHPGFVTAANIGQKLGKQQKIDLQHESLHIVLTTPLFPADLDDKNIQPL